MNWVQELEQNLAGVTQKEFDSVPPMRDGERVVATVSPGTVRLYCLASRLEREALAIVRAHPELLDQTNTSLQELRNRIITLQEDSEIIWRIFRAQAYRETGRTQVALRRGANLVVWDSDEPDPAALFFLSSSLLNI